MMMLMMMMCWSDWVTMSNDEEEAKDENEVNEGTFDDACLCWSDQHIR